MKLLLQPTKRGAQSAEECGSYPCSGMSRHEWPLGEHFSDCVTCDSIAVISGPLNSTAKSRHKSNIA